MADLIRILNADGELTAEQAAPAGLAQSTDGFELCGPTEFRAVAKVRKDQEVWLIERGLTGGTLVDGEPLTQSIPLASGVRVRHEDTEWITQLTAEAVAFRPAPTEAQAAALAKQQAARQRKKRVVSVLAGLFIFTIVCAVAGAGAWYFLKAPQPVRLSFDQPPQSVALNGNPIDDPDARLELPPGEHTLDAALPGYAPIRETITVRRGVTNTFEFEFEQLDGILTIQTNVEDAEVFIDGQKVTGDTAYIELPAGEYQIRVDAGEWYLPFEGTATVAGRRQETVIDASVQPNWGFVQLQTDPPGARVFDTTTGEIVETTPMNLRLLSGSYSFRIEADEPGYKPHTATVQVTPGRNIQLDPHRFEPLPGLLQLTSEPTGAAVLINGRTAESNTPLTAEIPPDTDVTVEVFAEGYKPARIRVNLGRGEADTQHVPLERLTGTVVIESEPDVAEVLDADGNRLGFTSLELTLPVAEQKLTVRKNGYNDESITLVPLAGRKIIRKARLNPAAGQAVGKPLDLAQAPEELTGPYDIKLRRIDPGEFTMGSPPDEPTRLPIEDAVKVSFTLPFYVQTTEVTNDLFRRFKATHNSGKIGFQTLNSGDRPAVSVSWDDAAAFCNHLSQQAGLDPVYRQQGSGMVAIDPLPNGYRLPTEAEMEYLLRTGSGDAFFPWGNFLPPPNRAGNFAGSNSKGTLNAFMNDYADAHAVSAPVGSYTADKNQLYDITGNAAEWTHDVYTPVYPSHPSPLVNYTGPKPAPNAGRVVRGASYLTHTGQELRSAFRRVTPNPAKDIGFRVVLSVQGAIASLKP
ncbi:MAG: SUMF1/EgtB/PvdO family nonheme iron enzyme [Planctomycetota bacterium]